MLLCVSRSALPCALRAVFGHHRILNKINLPPTHLRLWATPTCTSFLAPVPRIAPSARRVSPRPSARPGLRLYLAAPFGTAWLEPLIAATKVALRELAPAVAVQPFIKGALEIR